MRDLQSLSLANTAPNRTAATTIQQATSDKVIKSYEEAVRKLNTLQTNAAVLEKIRKERGRKVQNNLPNVINFAKRIGLTLDKLDKLSIIHVSGTKGKGSVCAFCESILSANGVKTGFYSSPHLVEVRERIRINGKPLARNLFTDYFFTVFNRLEDSKTSDDDDAMPGYFRFLTLMAYHVFLEERVDVAIMEVGIGGAYDCTNIHRCPTVVGISSLGIDHTGLLGNTIKEIAWQKAGICKPERPVFTVQQPEDGLDVIFETAKLNKVSDIHRCPSLRSYDFRGHPLDIGLSGEHQHINASLALQLCKTWMEDKQRGITFQSVQCDEPNKKKLKLTNGDEAHDASVTCDMPVAKPFILPDSFIKGLKDCYWPGRNQRFTRGQVTYYLDGAHTPRSMKACQKWFEDTATAEASQINGNVARILVFNSTGDRDEHTLIQPLVASQFDGVAFCPNITSVYAAQNSADQTNYNTTSTRQISRVDRNKMAFDKLLKESAGQPSHTASHQVPAAVGGNAHSKADSIAQPVSNPLAYPQSDGNDSTAVSSLRTNSEPVASSPSLSQRKTHTKLVALSCIQDAVQWAACAKDSQLASPSAADPTPPEACRTADHIQVLITGSLHLVGGVIKVLDSELVLKK